MRTLIRASQLNPDVSGLVTQYASGVYTSFDNFSGISGINAFKSGSYLVINQDQEQKVYSVNNLINNVIITGESGVYAKVSGQNIYIGYSGGGGGSVAKISGYGNVDVWQYNQSTYIISGISITGSNGIETSYNPFKTLLTVKGAGIGRINNITGNISLIGTNGIQVETTGQSIYFNGSEAAKSGVNSLNGLNNGPVIITGGNDISLSTNSQSKSIIVNYSGIGWGNSNNLLGVNSYVNYIGNSNTFNATTKSISVGDLNTIQESTGIFMFGSNESRLKYSNNSTFINTIKSDLVNLTGSTIINGTINNDVFRHPYAFGVGGSDDNTFTATFFMKAFLSGQKTRAPLVVPKTTYSGIHVPTGSVLFGEINYACVRYDITDFAASFDAKNFGIYGKKNFLVQRATSATVEVADESDLFGGVSNYGIFLSGGYDGNLYIFASGYSGNLPTDGLDGVHDTIFFANLNFVNFSVNPYL